MKSRLTFPLFPDFGRKMGRSMRLWKINSLSVMLMIGKREGELSFWKKHSQ